MPPARFDDPAQIDAYTAFEQRLDVLSRDATTPDAYRAALKEAFEGIQDEAVRQQVGQDYIRPFSQAKKEYLSLQENYRFQYGNPERLTKQAEAVPESLSPELQATAKELGDFREFLRGYGRGDQGEQAQSPSGEKIPALGTAMGSRDATAFMNPVQEASELTQIGVSPNEVMLDALDRKLERSSSDLRDRVASSPDFKDLLSRYSRASDLYLQMGAQRDKKANEAVALGLAGSFKEGQELVQGWLEDQFNALEGAQAELETRYGSIEAMSGSASRLPKPRRGSEGFMGVLEDAARGVLEAVDPVTGGKAGQLAGILFPRDEPKEFNPLPFTEGTPLADIAIVPANVQTLTEEAAALLGPLGVQFGVASIPARAAGGALAKAGVGRVAVAAGREAVRFGAAEAITPAVELGDLEERGKRAVIAGGVGLAAGATGSLVKKGIQALKAPKVKAVESPPPKPVKPVKVKDKPVEKMTLTELNVKAGTQAPARREKLLRSFEEVKPARELTEKLRTKERGIRITKAAEDAIRVGGREGHYASLRQMKDKLPVADFTPLEKSLSKREIAGLFDDINASKILTNDFHQLTARGGLEKMLKGHLPTPDEVSKLSQVFGGRMFTALEKFGVGQTFTKTEQVARILGISRSLMSGGELSGTLRQAITSGPRHPKIYGRAVRQELKSFASERQHREFVRKIANDPDFPTMHKHGLSMPSVTGKAGKFTDREEELLAADILEGLVDGKTGFQLLDRFVKRGGTGTSPLKVTGKYFRASNRAYKDLLTAQRVQLFKDMRHRFAQAGHKMDDRMLDEIAEHVNVFTGRGSLKTRGGKINLEKFGTPLAMALYSPRFQSSAIKILSPTTYIRKNKALRQEAITTLAANFTAASMTLALASKHPEIEKAGLNWKRADFGKIVTKSGVEIDLFRGLAQWYRLLARLSSGEIETHAGKRIQLPSERPAITRTSLAGDFVVQKAAPVPSLLDRLREGKSFDGSPLNVPKEVGSRLVPMFAQDLYEVWQQDPSLLPWITPLVFLGAGITVPTAEKKKRAKEKSRGKK